MKETRCACGQLVTTPFCPECGDASSRNGLAGLLVWLRGTEKRKRTTLETYKRNRGEAEAKLKPTFDATIQKLTSEHARWKGWSDQIRELLGAQQT